MQSFLPDVEKPKKKKTISREVQAEYNKRWNESEKGKEYRRKYYEEHKEKIKIKNNENYLKKKEQLQKVQELFELFQIIVRKEKQ